MYRQSSIRNQRSKGIKVKHALQICLLVAVCFWLIYQVKHSHDKKKEFDESDAKGSLDRGNSVGFIKLGRKDIQTQFDETMATTEKQDETAEEEENIGEEVEENRHEEENPEDKTVEDEEDEEMREIDDETDESELEKLDTEVDREEDFVDDQDREDNAEEQSEGRNSDDARGQIEKESPVKNADYDGDGRSTHETREKFYRADDGSSAGTHDSHIESVENENERAENSKEHHENVLEQENKKNNGEETNNSDMRKQLGVSGGEMAKQNNSNVTDGKTNVTTGEAKESNFGNSNDGLPPSDKLTEVSNDNLETRNRSDELAAKSSDLRLKNVTRGASESGHGQGIVYEGTSRHGSISQTVSLERTNASTLNVENNPFRSNATDHEANLSNLSNDTDSSVLLKITRSQASVNSGINMESAAEKPQATAAEKSDISGGTEVQSDY